jgi:hypothetical protein
LKARDFHSQLSKSQAESLEADFFLIDLATTLAGLGGSGAEVENKERLDWTTGELPKDLGRILEKIQNPEARLVAIHDLGAFLPSKGQGHLAIQLGNQLKGEDNSAPVTAAVVGLLLAHDKEGDAATLRPPPGKTNVDPIARMAYADGWIRKDRVSEAMELVQRNPQPLHGWQAATLAASCALQCAKTPEAQNFLQEAHKHWAALKGQRPPPALMILYARTTARLEAQDKARFSDILKRFETQDKYYRPRVNFEILSGYLTHSKSAEEDQLANEIPEKDFLSYGLALEAIARHNAAHGKTFVEGQNQEEKILAMQRLGSLLGSSKK